MSNSGPGDGYRRLIIDPDSRYAPAPPDEVTVTSNEITATVDGVRVASATQQPDGTWTLCSYTAAATYEQALGRVVTLQTIARHLARLDAEMEGGE